MMNVTGILRGMVQGISERKTQEEQQREEVKKTGEKQEETSVGYTLHWFDDTDGNTVVAAKGMPDGTSITVYRPADFNAANPEYLVKVWDREGNLSEQRVQVDEVNPEDATYLEMYAYCAYVSDNHLAEHAIDTFMFVSADMQLGFEDLNEKYNFKSAVQKRMQQQMELGNWQMYLKIKGFWDFLESTPYQEAFQKTQEPEMLLAEETSGTQHTPFDRYDGKKHAPYYEMADENGVICYNGVTFVCDDLHGALCLGDMSDERDVISIPLSGGGCLKVNRNNKADLARAIGMFSPEDIRRIMVALAQDNKIQQMENEIEDDESSLGESAQSIETTGDTIVSRISDRQNYNYFDGAADEVQQAWTETANETGIDGFGFDSTGKLTHISQVILKRLLTDKELPVFGNTLETAYDFARASLETLQQEVMDLSGKTKEAAEGYRQELMFYRVFVEKLSALRSLE